MPSPGLFIPVTGGTAPAVGGGGGGNTGPSPSSRSRHEEVKEEGGGQEVQPQHHRLQWHHIRLITGLFLGYASVMFTRAGEGKGARGESVLVLEPCAGPVEPMRYGNRVCVMHMYVCICAALDVAIPLMVGEGMGSAEAIGSMLVFCSLSYLLGKLSTGFGVDYFGGHFVFLWVSSFGTSALTGLVGTTHDIHRMMIIWGAASFCQVRVRGGVGEHARVTG